MADTLTDSLSRETKVLREQFKLDAAQMSNQTLALNGISAMMCYRMMIDELKKRAIYSQDEEARRLGQVAEYAVRVATIDQATEAIIGARCGRVMEPTGVPLRNHSDAGEPRQGR